MESEGTYTIKNTVNDLWLVYGPRGPLSGNIGHALAVAICAAANSGYAAGRKSMEKDFKELLELATRMYEMLNTIWLSFVPSYKAGILLKFYAWKKARGIE